MTEETLTGHRRRRGLTRGYVQVYTGDGKGKTTAALGLALRATGSGLRTYIGQFMKGQACGETRALAAHPLITLEQYGDVLCIRREEVTSEHRDRAQRGLRAARDAMLSGEYDLVVLDEANVAIWFGVLALPEVLALLDERPAQVELVITGRRAPQEIIDRADLVTEMREIKHYYSQGVEARVGIER